MSSLSYTKKDSCSRNYILSIVILASIVILGTISITSCFKLTLTEQQRLERQLEKRFNLYMQAKQEYNTSAVYALYSKRYHRRVSAFEFPKKEMPAQDKMEITITDFALKNVEYSNHHSEALLEFTMKVTIFSPLLPIAKPMEIESTLKERWVYTDNDWFREPNRVLTNLSGHPFYTDQY